MPLTPPPNYTNCVLALVIGVSLAVVVSVYTRSTLPRVGDTQHELPHGGWYKDGTKQVYYNQPCKLNSIEKPYTFWSQPWFIVSTLVLLIVCVNAYESSRCARCGSVH